MSTLMADREFPLLFVFLLLFPLILGYAIASKSYSIMVVPVAVLLFFLVLRSNVFAICIILFIVFFGNWMESLGLMPAQMNWLLEAVILLLFMKAISVKILKKEKINLDFIWVFAFFIFVSFVSYFISRGSPLHFFLFFRLMIRYYLLLLAIVNLDFDEKTMKILNGILVFLFIIQIPTAIVKFFIYGRGEMAIGTYAIFGGGPSTVIPLICISFLFAFYFFYKSSNWYILLALGFIVFGLVGGKRAIIVFLPVVILFLGFYVRDHFKNILKFVVVGSFIIFLTIFFSVRYLPSLNPEGHVGGTIDFNHLVNFFTSYTTYEYQGQSAGRVATTLKIFNILREKGITKLFLGFGPGSYVETRFESQQTTLKDSGNLPILYGTTGLSWLALQTGYIGALIYIFMFYLILRRSSQYFWSEKNIYWKAFALGVVGYSFVMIWISLTYWSLYADDMLPLVYFMVAGFMAVMSKRSNSNIESSNIVNGNQNS